AAVARARRRIGRAGPLRVTQARRGAAGDDGAGDAIEEVPPRDSLTHSPPRWRGPGIGPVRKAWLSVRAASWRGRLSQDYARHACPGKCGARFSLPAKRRRLRTRNAPSTARRRPLLGVTTQAKGAGIAQSRRVGTVIGLPESRCSRPTEMGSAADPLI